MSAILEMEQRNTLLDIWEPVRLELGARVAHCFVVDDFTLDYFMAGG